MSDSPLDMLSSVKYLYLRELSEPRDNSVLISVDEATDNRSALVVDSPSGALVTEYVPIETTGVCKSFELFWNQYVPYLVTEELTGSCGNYKDEIYTGKLLRQYTQSHFLAHLEKDTGAHPKPVQHYKLICLNHLIDVAAYVPPEIRLVTPAFRSGSHIPNLSKSR